METLDKAGKTFLGLEALLGGSGFQVDGNIWRRQVCGGLGGWGSCAFWFDGSDCPLNFQLR